MKIIKVSLYLRSSFGFKICPFSHLIRNRKVDLDLTTVRTLIFVRLASLGERLGWYDMKTLLELSPKLLWCHPRPAKRTKIKAYGSYSYYSNDSNKSIFTNDSKLLFLGIPLLVIVVKVLTKGIKNI